MNYLDPHWFSRPSQVVAQDLIGCTLVREYRGELVRGQIVETEAYEAGDPAMYAYQRRTERNAVVFGPAGIAYIYRIYRQYHCFNIVTDRSGLASTILIRAVDLAQWPSWVDANAAGAQAQSSKSLARLCAGPGKLCRVLHLDETLRGMPLSPAEGIWIEPRSDSIGQTPALEIVQTTRIGLSRGADLPWRWYLKNSLAVSRR